jgi:hypothetical protein
MVYKGVWLIRLGGTNEFVSSIDAEASHCWPPGEVKFVEGWDNPDALVFYSETDAKASQGLIWDIEGFHTELVQLQNEKGNISV